MATRGDRSKAAGAYDRALALLARREHSARELKSKLVRKGLDANESATALAALQAKDYQSDARFGEMLVRSRIAQGYGPRWIVAELKTHGVAEAKARNLLDGADVDWNDLMRQQLRRRFGAKPAVNAAERAKRAAFLLRRGFDAAKVRSITRAEGLDELD